MRLIDADKLTDYTDDRYSLGDIGRRERDDIVSALEYAPTIDAEPVRHGHWIKGGDENSIQCSVCHEWVSYDGSGVYVEDVDIYNDLEAHYCNFCGAKMDEEVR